MPQPYILNSALAFCTIPSLIGVNMLLNPLGTMKAFGFAVPATTEGQRLSKALMRMMGARNLTVSALCAVTWYYGDADAMGFAMGSLLLYGFVDGYFQKEMCGTTGVHPVVIPMIVGLAAGCFGMFG